MNPNNITVYQLGFLKWLPDSSVLYFLLMTFMSSVWIRSWHDKDPSRKQRSKVVWSSSLASALNIYLVYIIRENNVFLFVRQHISPTWSNKGTLICPPPPCKEGSAYCFAALRRSVDRSLTVSVHFFSQRLHILKWNIAYRFDCTHGKRAIWHFY